MPLRRKSIYKGSLVDLGLETVRLPDNTEFELEVVRHPGGAGVVAVDEQNRICLLRQYRHAAGGWLWEIPAGKIDTYEIPLLTAVRELEEEAGLKANVWTSLGTMLSTPGFCTEEIHLFMARGLEHTETQQEEHEHIEIHWVDFYTALTWIFLHKIRDAKTITALFQAQAYIPSGDVVVEARRQTEQVQALPC